MVIDRNYLQKHLSAMVRIDSRNPSLNPGAPGELELAGYIRDCLKDLALEVSTQILGERRVNVVARRKGSGGGKTLMLNGHLDTVGVEAMAEPFSGRIAAGRLYGRGSQDMKASLAAMLASIKALEDAKLSLKGDILLCFVADEEALSIGSEAIAKNYKADAAIVTEPSDLKICLAHRGFVWFEVETFGRAAHGSRYKEGIDANMHMGLFLAELYRLAADLLERPAHPLAGPPSLHVSLITGGSEKSTYAASCKALVERRTIPGETLAQVKAELQELITKLSAEIPHFKATVRASFERQPFEIHQDAAIVKTLEQACSKHLGKKVEYYGESFWTDAALLAQAGIETVLIGPIGQGLHSAEEWVDLASVYDLSAILLDTMITFCEVSEV